MGLYDTLKKRKQQGERLDMRNITRETLYRLWWGEERTDGDIADLYDVPRKKVTNLRHTWGVKAPETIVEEFVERFPDSIEMADEAEPPKRLSRTASSLWRKIQELNDTDLETLRLELGRRYDVFAHSATEVEFLSLVERIVSRF